MGYHSRTQRKSSYSFSTGKPEAFAPGLDPELQKLADALTDFKEKLSSKTEGVSKKVHESKDLAYDLNLIIQINKSHFLWPGGFRL
jgi:hypothetical protein